jgi:hypothetical protein
MHKEIKELKLLLEERDELFRNPTFEAAQAWWDKNRFDAPKHETVPLAAVHKARLQWLDATDAMLEESVKWLLDHGYETTSKGAPPLTPERRDADRVILGRLPLGKH